MTRYTAGKNGFVPLKWFEMRLMRARHAGARPFILMAGTMIDIALRVEFGRKEYLGSKARHEHHLIALMNARFNRLAEKRSS